MSPQNFNASSLRRPLIPFLALVVAAAMAGCSRGESKTTSQVAVKVGDAEVTVHQVNAQLTRLSNVPKDKQEEARKTVVEGLIGQQLLVAQAVEAKLDRDPQVQAAMEEGRAQLLTQAYLQKFVEPKAKPSSTEVKTYYDAHPELFAKRRVFRLQEIATDLPVAQAGELEKVVTQTPALDKIVSWLQSQKRKVAADTAVRGAEQLPIAQLARISSMKDGEITVLKSGQQLTVLRVVTSQEQPLNLQQATPAIERYLSAQKRQSLVRDEIKALRDKAKIEFVGEFKALEKVAVAAEAPTPEPAGSPPPAVDPAAPADAASAMSKGLAGLR